MEKFSLKYIVLIGILFAFGHLMAQHDQREETISLGYFGHGIINPGIILTVEIPINDLNQSVNGSKINTLFTNASIAVFTKPNFYSSYMFEPRIGINRHWSDRPFFFTYSIGLGYINTLEVLNFSVDFNGEISEKKRESRSSIFPSIQYGFGKHLNEKSSIYTRFTFGHQISFKQENASQLFFELGYQYKIIHLSE